MEELDDILRDVLQKSIRDLHPSVLLKKCVRKEGSKLVLGDKTFDVSERKVYVIGCGKAGISMAEALEDILGADCIEAGVVVAPDLPSKTEKIRIVKSTHPFISEKSFAAGKVMLEFVKNVEEGSLVISLLSGGGSALMACPEEGLSTKEKINFVNELILEGVNELEVNVVRKALSAVKGGKLALQLKGCEIVNLYLLDNSGNVAAIASGPTMIPEDEKSALQVLREHELFESAPLKVKQVLEAQKELDFSGLSIDNVCVGDNPLAREVVASHARKVCDEVWVMSEGLFYVEVRDAVKKLVSWYKEKYKSARSGVYAVIAGGEIPVRPKTSGKGGRNQHVAALMLKELSWLDEFAFASCATDGCDFLQGVHGGLISHKTRKKMKLEEASVEEYIEGYNSFALLKRFGGLIEGGLSGTNVSDVYVLFFKK